jgi:patatin-related protein
MRGGVDLEDVRLAVVLNGGVSLCVWIGGVAREIGRLSKGDEPFYQTLRAVTASSVRVDVIAGTSAGGINGPALALAEIFGQSLAPLGELWVSAGGFLDLFNSPLEKDPQSLLKGDAYLLPHVVEAFKKLRPEMNSADTKGPMDLTVTGALWHGERVPFFDDFGSQIVESVHQLGFHFRREDPDWLKVPDGPAGEVVDSFGDPKIVAQLALAARSTSANPFGFEASWVPVDDSGDQYHPNMARVAQVVGGMPLDCGRFVLDGGILINKPVGPALAAIASYPAESQVRRLLMYVQPDPGNTSTVNVPDDPKRPPTLVGVFLASGIELPKAQSIAADLAAIRDHNSQARLARASRADRYHAFDVLDTDDLTRLAGNLLVAYRRVRARPVAELVAQLWRQETLPRDVPGSGSQTPPSASTRWAPDELLAAFGVGSDDPDCYPDAFVVPTADGPCLDADVGNWGLEPVIALAASMLDISRRAMWLAPVDDNDLRARIRGLRRGIHNCRRWLRLLEAADVAFWKARLAALPVRPDSPAQRREKLRQWARDACKWPWAAQVELASDGPGAINGRTVAQRLIALMNEYHADVMTTTRPRDDCSWTVPRAAEEAAALKALTDGLMNELADRVRFVAIEVCRTMLGGGAPDPGLEIGLMQVSGYTPNAFGITAAPTKLTGVQLSHFGAFYKQAWRSNDWIWGRLDGAFRAVQAMLDPARLAQRGYTSTELSVELHGLATGAVGTNDRDYLEQMWKADSPTVLAELAFLDVPGDVPVSLPATVTAVARRVQLEILRDELPRLASAAQADLEAGSKSGDKADRFRIDYYHAAQHAGTFDGAKVVDLWTAASIGEETLQSEAGSDLLAMTVSTAAAGLVNVLESTRSGLGPVRAVAKALRGATLLLYLLARASIGGGFGAAITNLTLAVGGALLAVTLMVPSTPPVLALIGTTILLAGLVLAALRVGIGVFVVIFAVLLAVAGGIFALDHVKHWLHTSSSTWWTVAAVAGLATAAMGLGSVHRSPKAKKRATQKSLDQLDLNAEAKGRHK